MNWNKFKAMSIIQKVQWIVQYYGLMIVVMVAVLIVGTAFMKSVFGAQKEYGIRVMVLDDFLSSEALDRFRRDLTVALKGECDITSYMEKDLEHKQAFTIRLGVDELDVVIAPKKEMEELQKNGYLVRMEVINQESFYYRVTRKDSHESDYEMYIGETVKSNNRSNVDTVINYMQGRK